MSQLDLSTLLTPADADAVFAIMLAVLQKYGFPTTAWEDFGTDKTRFAAVATAIAAVSSKYVADIAAGGFVDFATGDWLRLLAAELYNILYQPATRTIGNVVLTAAPSAGPYTIGAGQLTVVFPSGNRYVNVGSGTLTTGGTLTLSFQSEFANDSANGRSYNDHSDQTLSLVTSLPGVTVTNPSTAYGAQAHNGSGTGTLNLTGSPSTFHQVTVRIDSTGDMGVASWSTSLDGAPFVSQGTVSSITNLGGTGINIALANGAVSPSFVGGDTYTWVTPGDWKTQQGVDIETDSVLATRCRNRWPSLSAVPTRGMYQEWALSVPGAGVTQVTVVPDTVINNRLNIVIAGPAGALPAGAISAVQSFISARAPITDLPVVLSPTPLTITVGGQITVAVNKLAAAQAAIQVAVTDYLDSIGTNGTVRLASLTRVIDEIDGVIDITGLTINGAAQNLPLGSSTTFVIPASTPVFNFTYATVGQ